MKTRKEGRKNPCMGTIRAHPRTTQGSPCRYAYNSRTERILTDGTQVGGGRHSFKINKIK